MVSYIASLLIALLVAAIATPLVRRAAMAVGAVDGPTARRVHTRRIPRMGGLAIVAAFFAPLLVLFALNTQVARLFFVHTRLVGGLAIGSLLVAAVGAADDIFHLGAKRKLLGQTACALIAFYAGCRIDAITLPLLGTISMGPFALPVTVIWIVGIVNALNLIDGLDGLAAGVAFFACLSNFVIAYIAGNVFICLSIAALAGAILGFLFHNFNPATIFMGDSGSMFLGYLIAAVSLVGGSTQKGGTAVAIVVPILALGLPIMDTLFAMARRIVERRSIFSPDRGHIHHRLVDLGLTQRRAVLVLYGICVLFTGCALAFYVGHAWQSGLALVALTIGLVGTVRFVGYFQTVFLQDRMRRLDPSAEGFRRAVPDAIQRIEHARSVDDLPEELQRFCEAANILAVEMVAKPNARVESWRWEAPVVSDRREAVSASFTLADAAGVPIELKFLWDCVNGNVSPQADVLLQLVADASERLLVRVARARDAAKAGRLRPVS